MATMMASLESSVVASVMHAVMAAVVHAVMSAVVREAEREAVSRCADARSIHVSTRNRPPDVTDAPHRSIVPAAVPDRSSVTAISRATVTAATAVVDHVSLGRARAECRGRHDRTEQYAEFVKHHDNLLLRGKIFYLLQPAHFRLRRWADDRRPLTRLGR